MQTESTTADREFAVLIADLGRQFAPRAGQNDETDTFVAKNFEVLRQHKVFSAAVPVELGGGGVSHRQMCAALRTLGGYCGSTALALSMHQHLVAAQVWNHRHGKPGAKLLQRVAKEELILVSTGANDWLSSSGELERVDGGYKLTAMKPFASGSPMGAMLVTSAPYEDPEQGWQVLHFAVPLSAAGVRIGQDWRALGMRGTGSNTVALEGVFVREETVALRRPRGQFHPAFAVILTVAMPYIVSVYVGVAEAAARIARARARKRIDDPVVPYLLGELENSLATAQISVDSMTALANNYEFEPSVQGANAILIRKTIAAEACLETVEKCMEVTGGAGYFRELGLERLLRDVHAAQFHPLPPKRQQLFTGRLAMGLDPVES